jgi:hypothetical protein
MMVISLSHYVDNRLKIKETGLCSYDEVVFHYKRRGSNNNEMFDAFRLALKFYHFREKDNY